MARVRRKSLVANDERIIAEFVNELFWICRHCTSVERSGPGSWSERQHTDRIDFDKLGAVVGKFRKSDDRLAGLEAPTKPIPDSSAGFFSKPETPNDAALAANRPAFMAFHPSKYAKEAGQREPTKWSFYE